MVYYFTMLQNCGTMELWFTMENYGTIEKNYPSMDKTMVLYRELWNFDLRRKKHDRSQKSETLIDNAKQLF